MGLVDGRALWLALAALGWLGGAEAGRGAAMGVKTSSCDDGQTNLTRDWAEGFAEFTCAHRRPWPVRPDVPARLFSIPGLDIPNDGDNVYHHCMNDSIVYEDKPPLRGDHRPIWARFGEYLYLPPQRWLHNLEHGTIVLLYHPCADPQELDALRRLVTACLYRHVITPYPHLPKTRPLALLSWGSRLSLNAVKPEEVKKFIREHAKVAPEDLSKDGGYDHFLLKAAEVVTDRDDSVLCPSPLHPATIPAPVRRVKRRGDPNTEYYNRVYLAQLRRFNGPKFASDVLPPNAVLNQYRQPKYVMAGTYLGKDPLNPQIVPHTPNVPKPPPHQAQAQQQQAGQFQGQPQQPQQQLMPNQLPQQQAQGFPGGQGGPGQLSQGGGGQVAFAGQQASLGASQQELAMQKLRLAQQAQILQAQMGGAAAEPTPFRPAQQAQSGFPGPPQRQQPLPMAAQLPSRPSQPLQQLLSTLNNSNEAFRKDLYSLLLKYLSERH